MATKLYGGDTVKHSQNFVASKTEELKIQGFTVFENLLTNEQLTHARESLDRIYTEQELSFGKEKLRQINELDVARCPFSYDEFFLHDIILNQTIIAFIKNQLGDYFVVHLQNGIINRPNIEHHQSSWHRDLPYQNYVISRPIAIGVLFCLDTFSEETGGTFVLPFTHQVEHIPSQEYVEKFQTQVHAAAGSAIVFNAMLFHRAGYNTSPFIRRAVNNVYTVPIIKQQIDLPRFLNGKYSSDPLLKKMLGYESQSSATIDEYRSNRLNRI
jgi:ectoine hydroxylase-related dioxygenase (phytanoyl-CoA dioxygenase family)